MPDIPICSVPGQLADALDKAAALSNHDQVAVYYAMACKVIRFYLGSDWVTTNVQLSDTPDSFMQNGFDERSDSRFVHQHRVIYLADYLFRLRVCPGFDILCERFHRQNTKSSFAEAQIAASFLDEELQVNITATTGKRGEDFDFTVSREGLNISVEVTSRDVAPLSVETVINTLQKKRTQVPTDRPAVLYIVIPTEWTADGKTAEAIFAESTTAFFRNSARINAVVFVWEPMIIINEGMIVGLAQRPYEHPHPRHCIGNSQFLRPEHPIGDLEALRYRAAYDTANLENELKVGMHTTTPSFYLWQKNRNQKNDQGSPAR
ncbi:MAG: hypothetical protein WDZ63_09650 [Burkholderiales bacterium]